jgi:uncharacterized protein
MKLSKHNIISRITDSENYFLINLLSQNADIISSYQYQKLMAGEYENTEELLDKGYLVDAEAEESLYKQKYLDFIDNRETDEIQLFFSLTYKCNFACSYCYQDEYLTSSQPPEKSVIDAFFNYIIKSFGDRRKYITLFGGEPLLNASWQREFIQYFIDLAVKNKLDIALVTNGYHLAEYIPILKKASIREIQVTLDGMNDVHDKRRALKDKSPTFNKIVEGIDKALENELPVNLRMVIDKENIQELPKLANYAITKGWTANPLFKTQFGRNYELHHCQRSNERLYSRISMYHDIYTLLKSNPEIMEFHKPAFSVSRYLFENGTLPDPLFDSCPGTKTEWAFDYTVSIFSCTATVGKDDEKLGTFYPDFTLNKEKVMEWEERDILSIPECQKCELQLACGGGCGSVAKNKSGN